MNQKHKIDLSEFVRVIPFLVAVIMMASIHSFNDYLLKISSWKVMGIMLSLMVLCTILIYIIEFLINKNRQP